MDMNTHRCAHSFSRILSLVLILACAVAAAGCNKLRARNALNKGVQAYKGGQFDTAIEFFKKAKEFDPELLNARLYLATAYASQYIPGAPSEENVRKGEQAIQEFTNVLEIDPKNLSAIDGIGSLLFNMASAPFDPVKFDRSKEYHLKHVALRPEDPEPYYWIGYIAWTLSYKANTEARASYNQSSPRKQIKDEEPLPARVREAYAAKYGATIEEGIRNLQQAIQLRPDYDEAMGMLNLSLRRKADTVADSAARDQLLQEADAFVEKVKEIRQRKAQQTTTPTS